MTISLVTWRPTGCRMIAQGKNSGNTSGGSTAHVFLHLRRAVSPTIRPPKKSPTISTRRSACSNHCRHINGSRTQASRRARARPTSSLTFRLHCLRTMVARPSTSVVVGALSSRCITITTYTARLPMASSCQLARTTATMAAVPARVSSTSQRTAADRHRQVRRRVDLHHQQQRRRDHSQERVI